MFASGLKGVCKEEKSPPEELLSYIFLEAERLINYLLFSMLALKVLTLTMKECLNKNTVFNPFCGNKALCLCFCFSKGLRNLFLLVCSSEICKASAAGVSLGAAVTPRSAQGARVPESGGSVDSAQHSRSGKKKREASLLLIVRPGAPSSFLLLVAMPFAPSSALAPSSNARSP